METLKSGQVRFALHAPGETDDGEVDASVFATKLGQLIRALKAADKSVNRGVSAHRYTIARLHTSTPTAIINEQPSPQFANSFPMSSGIPAFDECADAISMGSEKALEFGETATFIERLAKGASTKFGYAEVWTDNDSIIRVDPFLKERARAVTAPQPEIEIPVRPWFSGVVVGTFDGVLQVVDLRGSLPAIKLKLSAGGKEVDCVCRADHVETIGASLNKRVRISGRAIYDGKSGLPRRVEVADIVPVSAGGDFARWKGAFEPFDVPDWHGDDV
ncbi:MAG: hypothetical protein KDK08_25350 [Rhizobiaceae bacterium]|nr:hypothetical protein [Rhizobiaceae bacterium]